MFFAEKYFPPKYIYDFGYLQKLPGKKISHTMRRRTIPGLGIILARQKITDEEDMSMMLLKDGESAVKAQAKEWPNGPKPVGEPLFSAYRMDRVPDDCDVMVKLRAKFAQYEEEDQRTGYVRSFLHHPGQEAEDPQQIPCRDNTAPLHHYWKPRPLAARTQAACRIAGEIAHTLYGFMGGCA